MQYKHIRWRKWDYATNATYFITICTRNRRHNFGSVLQGCLDLSPLGKHASVCWSRLADRYTPVVLDEYVIMPNHVHGIVGLDPDADERPLTLGAVVRRFKIDVTQYANANHLNFGWQRRYHDRVVRNQRELQNIREYIANNPAKWEQDRYFTEHR